MFPDYPSKGVDFLDLWSLFASACAQRQLVHALCGQIRSRLGGLTAVSGDGGGGGDATTTPPDFVIAGLEMRGVMLGGMLAAELGVGFVPLRKVGSKLPGAVLSSGTFATEYGAGDAFQVQTQYLPHMPHTCIVVDDVIASGGSMHTGCALLERAGLDVVLVVAVMDVPELRVVWRRKLRKYDVALCIE